MEVRIIDPSDGGALAEWHAVFETVERETWPDRTCFNLRDVRSFAAHAGTARRFRLFAATEPGGGIVGVGFMELPMLDNRHAADVTVSVHPQHRRRGIGRALVEALAHHGGIEGRTVLNSIVDVPVAVATGHPSAAFARSVGFVATLPGNSRYLQLPLDEAKVEELLHVVDSARDAASYRTMTFRAPWPAGFLGDQCELHRRMSTDEPAGDGGREEEVWDERRLREEEELLAERGVWKLAAVAQHVDSGRIVAFSELLLSPDDAPTESWQLVTVVDPEHRGHRLGLALKLANIEALAERAPEVRRILTGNASVNAPMIAVNDLMGFEVAGAGFFWQKQLAG